MVSVLCVTTLLTAHSCIIRPPDWLPAPPSRALLVPIPPQGWPHLGWFCLLFEAFNRGLNKGQKGLQPRKFNCCSNVIYSPFIKDVWFFSEPYRIVSRQTFEAVVAILRVGAEQTR